MEGVLYQVAETLPAEVLEKMHAPPKDEEVPVVDPHTIDQVRGGSARARARWWLVVGACAACCWRCLL